MTASKEGFASKENVERVTKLEHDSCVYRLQIELRNAYFTYIFFFYVQACKSDKICPKTKICQVGKCIPPNKGINISCLPIINHLI